MSHVHKLLDTVLYRLSLGDLMQSEMMSLRRRDFLIQRV